MRADTIVLGETSLRVPAVGVGTANWGDPSELGRLDFGRIAYGSTSPLDDQRAAVDVSIEAGARFFDTAAMYGSGASERALGALTRDKDVFIATKFPSRFSAGAGALRADLDASLARLGRRSVDLYQVHTPLPWLSIPRTMKEMARAAAEQKIRAVGVSNFSAEQMRLAHRALAEHGLPLATNQVEYSLLRRTPETNGVLAACRELGVTLVAYMPLAMGALGARYRDGRRPEGIRRFLGPFRAGRARDVARAVDVLTSIAEELDRPPAQVALRWLVEKGVLPIPGARNAEQARTNAGALAFSLTPTQLEALDDATTTFRG